MLCTSCDKHIEDGWEHCGSCGTVVTDAQGGAVAVLRQAPPVTAPTRTAPAPVREFTARSTGSDRGTPPAWKIAVAVLAVLALTGLVFAVMQTNTLAKTRRDLATSERTSVRMEVDLTSTRETLAETRTKLSDRETTIEALESQVLGLRGRTNRQADELRFQESQIATLKGCLEGVTNALIYLSHSDGYSAMASLRSVESICQQAFALFG